MRGSNGIIMKRIIMINNNRNNSNAFYSPSPVYVPSRDLSVFNGVS